MQRFFLFILTILSSSLHAQIKRNADITADELFYHVNFLASDSLKGRQPGTVHDKIAAKYIRDEFRSYDLTLLGKKGYQFFAFKQFNPNYENQTHLMVNGIRLTIGQDYSAPTVNGSDSLCANAVFVGKGDTHAYYQKAKVRKKWAVIFYQLKNNSYELLNPSAIELAKANGAAGILLVSNDTLSKHLDVDFRTLPNIPIFILSPKASDMVLKQVGSSSELAVRMNKRETIQSKELDVRICGKVARLYHEVETQNVVAMLRGSDPLLANEYIIIGAHYDHLGMGDQGGSRSDSLVVHNGADDNASGVVVMLEVAHKLASVRKDIKRSIVFVAFGAEEKGLIGSQRFVDSAIVPIESIKAMINIDMVGRLRNRELEIHGTKTSLEADSILNVLNADSLFQLKLVPDGFGPSDHSSFYAKGIPVFFFHTGLHEDYHTPKDDVEFLNIPGMQQVTDFAYRLTYQLATSPTPLTFSKSSTRSLSSSRTPKIKVKLGLMPDVSGANDNGLKVIGVTEGKPADLAGIKAGDIITSINGSPIRNIYDYTDALSTLEPGGKAVITLLRENSQVELTVEF